MLPSLNSLLEIIEGEDDLREHLPGEHDQKTHGRRNPQIDTPEFKAWFGNSKVVDENGDPLVVYHGTVGNFTTFDKSKFGEFDDGWLGEGFYFSDTAKGAEDYTRDDISRLKRQSAEGGNILPVYLSMENPLIVDFSLDDLGQPWNSRSAMSAKEFSAILRKRGHDGVIFKGPVAPSGLSDNQFMVFDPTQIKSATGNRGTFDPNSPKINEAHDGPS